MAKLKNIDTVTFEVVSSALESIAEEMGGVLKRSSYSPMIRDMDDFSCAIFSPTGDLVAQADYIPAQLGAMSLVVKNVIEKWSGRISEGDVFISNHPYMGAMHLPDINIISPVFREDEIVGWCGTAAHHIDVGGANPGSEGAELQDLYAEGLVFPAVRLYKNGEENEDLFLVLQENIRDPRSTLSDLRAQRAAGEVGKQRLLELFENYGVETLNQVMSETLNSAEAGVRNVLRSLPDGVGEAEGHLDDDGRGGEPTRVHVRVTKTGDVLHIDLSGSSDQVSGAMNVPWASARAGIVYAVRAVVAPDLRANDGIIRPLTIDCPKGKVLNPEFPAAVSLRHNTCQRFADTLIRALADLWPDRAVASSTVSFFSVNIGSSSPFTGTASVMADVVGGGTGAHARGDGIDGVDTYMANVGIMPAEVLETNYELRVLRTELVPGSQGRGKHNGGLGLRREYQILNSPQRVTFYSEQTNSDFAPMGACGGSGARATKVTVTEPDGTIKEQRSKATVTLQPGAVLRVETAGGGGYGKSSERSEALKLYDEENDRLGPDMTSV